MPKVKSKFVKCCICEMPIEIDKMEFIVGGGTAEFVFGYGSMYDGSKYNGYVCDKCFGKLRHLKEIHYL
jgi:hypothetical protein